MPLLSVATSTVATAFGEHEGKQGTHLNHSMTACAAKGKQLSSGHALSKGQDRMSQYVHALTGSREEVSKAASAVLLLAIMVGLAEVTNVSCHYLASLCHAM